MKPVANGRIFVLALMLFLRLQPRRRLSIHPHSTWHRKFRRADLVDACLCHAISRKPQKLLFVVAAMLLAATASAQSSEKTLMVFLSEVPGTPTPQMLAVPVDFSAGYLGLPIGGFTVENPIRAFYLLPQRATGDFAAWLEGNPDSASRTG